MKRVYPVIVLLMIFATGIWAHPAEDIVMSYDTETNLLTVKVVHNSKDFNKHFIEKVWVSVDKKEIIGQSFTSQDDLEKLELQYKIFHLKKGDEVTVDTKCNIYGKKSTSFTIP